MDYTDNVKQETWKSLKDVVECGDYYEVSNLGRVRSLDKNVKHSIKGFRTIKGKVMNTWLDKDGYVRCGLALNNKAKQYMVHRLVALAFIFNTENKSQVNHIDGNKKNNYVENLEWVTGKENQCHATKTGLRDNIIGENHFGAKLTNEKVIEIYNAYEEGKTSMQELSLKYDLSPANVRNILNGTLWKHLNLKPKNTKRIYKSVITEDIKKEIFRQYKDNMLISEISLNFNISRKPIENILKSEDAKSVGIVYKPRLLLKDILTNEIVEEINKQFNNGVKKIQIARNLGLKNHIVYEMLKGR